MRTLTLELPEEVAANVERYAADLGLTMDEFVLERCAPDLVKRLSQSAQEWTPLDQWQALVRGEGCLICQDLSQETVEINEGFKVCDLNLSRLWLMRNQFVQGYCVLTCLKHVREPFELEASSQQLFFEELMCAGRAINALFQPDKVNFEIQGNRSPHLHCHIKPRYHGDSAPGLPIDQNARQVHLKPHEYAETVSALRGLVSAPE